jgi:DNA-binding helix-hairpin-helix protein with protein kinase domain
MNQELAGSQQRLQAFHLAFDQERQRLAADENQALRASEQDARRQAATLQVELNNLSHAERNELSQAEADYRRSYVTSRLQSEYVRHASLHRIGHKLKDRLEASGIRTAADVEYYRVLRVEGFGPALAGVLRDWRDTLEAVARHHCTSFPAGAADAIRSRYATRKRQLENQIVSINHREQRMRDEVLERFQQARAAYDEQERQTVATFDNDEASIRAKYQRELQRVDGEYRTQKAKLSGVLREQDSRVADLNRQKTEQRFEVCRLERQIEQLRRLSWGRYLGRTFGLVRAA